MMIRRVDAPIALHAGAKFGFSPQSIAETKAEAGHTSEARACPQIAGMAAIPVYSKILILLKIQASAGTNIQAGYWLRLGDQPRLWFRQWIAG